MSKVKKISVFILILVGLIVSFELSKIYVDANFNPYALSSFCSINDVVDCDAVARTVFSQVLGIPLAFWGIILYFIFLFFLFVDKVKNIKYLKFTEVFKNPDSYITTLGALAFCCSMILALIMGFLIKKICILCIVTYFIDLSIALISKDYKKNFFYELKQSFSDLFDALKIKKYLVSFLSVVLLGTLFLTYTTFSNVLTPQVRKINSIKEFMNIKGNPFGLSGNIVGDKNGTVVIDEYTDYQCPFCSILNLMLHRAASELKNVKVVQHDFPLDTECNDGLSISTHVGSCQMARYAIASKNQNRFVEMSLMLFEKKPVNEKEILKEAQKLGFDVKKLSKDANSQEIKNILKDEVADAYRHNVDATPTFIINMKKYTGTMPYYELKDLLIKLGAVEK